MPGLVKDEEQPFKTIEVKKLHPTFAAEVSGVDFENVSEEQFSEILAAMAKVRKRCLQSYNLSFLIPLLIRLSAIIILYLILGSPHYMP